MATVRLTEDLTKKIMNNVNVVFDARVVASCVPPPEFNANDIYELWLDGTPGLREDIPIGIRHGWLVRAAKFSVQTLNSKPVAMEVNPSASGVWVPYAIANSYGTGFNLKGPRAGELLEIWIKWRNDYDAVRGGRDQFNDQIKNLLKRHKTLKQALSEWPALWDFVPDEFKKRHNEEKERLAQARTSAQARDRNKPSVDLDVLNGAIVTAKILKGWMD
jgi:hypothetical protein